MAFSFRNGINWYHDFPKLARDSGFYFNMHKNKMRIDWNRIAGIDIEHVIQDRNFLIIDENINSVIDYNLDSEYDVKILDPNFVKLFRLAQLAVEYLLYCKQYLDHSVAILKDELRSKIEENVKLKKELALADEDLSLLKDKLKNKYKIFEKMYSETQKDVYKCPYCKKTFSSAICTSYHIGRRHSNSSQFSSTSPVHEQSKTEKEKLQDEIKSLKERLNQTERVISNESDKSPRNMSLNGNHTTDIQSNEVTKDKGEEEHKKYQDEINNLKTIFLNEIKNLRDDEKKSNQLDNENENLKELLKQQENEIHQLTDQIRELASKQSAPNLEMIQLKLINQEEYWKSKIDQMESQHTKDIEELSTQLRMTQEMAEKMRNDYIINIKKLEEKTKKCNENVQSIPTFSMVPKQNEEDKSYEKHVVRDRKENNTKFIDEKNVTTDDGGKISANSTDSSEKIENNSANLQNQSHLKSECPDSYEKHLLHQMKHRSQSVHTKALADEKETDYKLSKQHNRIRRNLIKKMNAKIDVPSSQSDVSESESETLSKSEDSEESQSTENPEFLSEEFTESDEDKFVQKGEIFTKNKENFKQEVLSELEQKLLDLGVDIEMDGIPKPTYQRLITIVKHHRNVSNKKYQALEEIRRNIINKINKKFLNQGKKKQKLQIYNTPKKMQLKKNISNHKLKIDSSAEIKSRSSTPKIKFEKSSFVKHFSNENKHELLPMKMDHPKFHDVNNARSKLLTLKQDENKRRLFSNKKKSGNSQSSYTDSMQQEHSNSKTLTSFNKNENTNKFIDDGKHQVIFSSKSLKQNDNDKDEVDIVSINDDDDDDDDDGDDDYDESNGNEASNNQDVIKKHKKLSTFPQPAPRVTKEHSFQTLQLKT